MEMGHSFLQAASRVVSYGWHSRDLQAQLAQARLEALRPQLHPHFLFNTLNAISALVHHDAEAADLMIERLGAFLRGVLSGDPAAEVPLADELRLVGDYLRLEELRFGD